jgi:hypothetical protein
MRYLKTLLAQRRSPGRRSLVSPDEPPRSPVTGRLSKPYGEQLFHWFLSIEHRRCERSSRPLLLLLADLTPRGGVASRIDPMIAQTLLDSLRSSLRQTDIVGWYRQDRVAGALLAESRNGPGVDVSKAVRQRVIDGLQARLPPELVRQFRLRIRRYPESQDMNPTNRDTVSLTHSAVGETR